MNDIQHYMRPGTLQIMSRATSNSGEKQVETLKVNPAGYHNNLPRPLSVSVA